MDRVLKGAVLGNGPSRDLYDYSAEVVIGCNIPGEGYSVDATVICDPEVVWLLKSNPDLITSPLIVSTKAQETLKQLRIDHLFDIIDVFKPRDWHTSGHYAAWYLINEIECQEVDVWGCDSYFVNDSTSATDLLLPKTGDLFYKQWRNTWEAVIHNDQGVKVEMKR